MGVYTSNDRGFTHGSRKKIFIFILLWKQMVLQWVLQKYKLLLQDNKILLKTKKKLE